MTTPNYREYIRSKEWYAKHKEFLQQAGYRCAFTGQRIGKGKAYAIHHIDYSGLGEEVYGKHVLCSSRWFHRWVIHGILSGFKSAGKQGDYPNTAQSIVHAWGLLPGFVKLGLIGSTGWLIVNAVLSFPGSTSAPHSTKIWATSSQFVLRSMTKLSHKRSGSGVEPRS